MNETFRVKTLVAKDLNFISKRLKDARFNMSKKTPQSLLAIKHLSGN